MYKRVRHTRAPLPRSLQLTLTAPKSEKQLPPVGGRSVEKRRASARYERGRCARVQRATRAHSRARATCCRRGCERALNSPQEERSFSLSLSLSRVCRALIRERASEESWRSGGEARARARTRGEEEKPREEGAAVAETWICVCVYSPLENAGRRRRN